MTAHVAWLSIAPVKSLRVQEVAEVHIDAHGARGDRRFVLTDEAWHLVNGKQVPTLVRVVAEVGDGFLSLTFPGGATVRDEPRLGEPATMVMYGELRPVRRVLGPWAEALSEWSGRRLRMVQPVDAGDGVDRGHGAGVSLLARASLDRLAAAAGVGIDRRRFRMTVGFDGAGAFEEERWMDRVVSVGEATIRVTGNVGRCAVTTAHPDTGAVDLPTLHLLRGLRDGVSSSEPLPLGVWGDVVQPGVVRVGDEVRPA